MFKSTSTQLIVLGVLAVTVGVAHRPMPRPMPAGEAVTFEEYENMLGLPQWALLEDAFHGRQ